VNANAPSGAFFVWEKEATSYKPQASSHKPEAGISSKDTNIFCIRWLKRGGRRGRKEIAKKVHKNYIETLFDSCSLLAVRCALFAMRRSYSQLK
jgi:hypothetical protein